MGRAKRIGRISGGVDMMRTKVPRSERTSGVRSATLKSHHVRMSGRIRTSPGRVKRVGTVAGGVDMMRTKVPRSERMSGARSATFKSHHAGKPRRGRTGCDARDEWGQSPAVWR